MKLKYKFYEHAYFNGFFKLNFKLYYDASPYLRYISINDINIH